MAQLADPREAGREAAGRHAWQEAYDLLSGLDNLEAEDLAALADAAYWSGRLDEALELRERAHGAYVDAGERRRAAAVAVRLAMDYLSKGAGPLFGGWLAKAERLLGDDPDAPEQGLLELGHGLRAMFAGDLDATRIHAERVIELSRRIGDRALEALGRVGLGRALLLQGRLDEGLALLDEASATAMSGEVDPFSSCFIYCTTITTCHGLGDYERARQWTDAANRWCDRQEVTGFPGACRVHRSEILRLAGDWDAAEQEAVSACSELESYDVFTTASGYYQLGEIRRRRGDFAAAEEAYRKSHELGRDPQPGLALLRLAQGKATEALAALRRSLGEDARDPLARARRLPAQIEISLEVGEVDAARAALDELEEITDRFRISGERTPLLSGWLDIARGQIELADEHWDEAETCLQRAVATWTRIGAPYEAAKARMLLGMAYAQHGDAEGAQLEYEAARAAFERLGAVLDAQRAMELLGEAETRRTFMFTDIVNSTKLLEAIGDEKFARQLDRHDELLRHAIETAGGEVIKHTGDGFFAAFDTPSTAVAAAVAIQRALADELLNVRIGVHSGEALERGSDYAGRGVSVATRVGALAGPGQILVSRQTLDGVALPYRLAEPRVEELKGFSEPVELVRVAWR